MVLQSNTKEDYVGELDSSVPQTSPVLTLRLPTGAYGWQFRWDESTNGKFIFEASIYGDQENYQWEQLIVCEEVVVETSKQDTYSSIVSIPGAWGLVRFIRWRFEPGDGSSGIFSAAIRVVP